MDWTKIYKKYKAVLGGNNVGGNAGENGQNFCF